MERNQLPYLPHELIIQILQRLPVKPLIRFKSVCKSWFSLISHPQFANSHFQLPKILLISTSTLQSQSVNLEPSLASVSLNLDFLLSESYSDLQIKASFKGFILLHCSSNIFLWNPSTGIHKKIPLPPFGSSQNVKSFYGFGYDQSTNDYLLVSMSYFPFVQFGNISPHIELFSVRANTWKEIDSTHFPYRKTSDEDPSIFNNGAIHWLAYHLDSDKCVIVVFDLMERKLCDMYLPDDFNRRPNDRGLWVFGEFLSLWAMYYDKNIVEIWVMKEYKVHSSWTNTLVLSITGIPYFSPVCCTKSGDIIGTDGLTGLVKYNEKGELLKHNIYSCKDAHGFKLAMYTESLFSLPSDNEQA